MLNEDYVVKKIGCNLSEPSDIYFYGVIPVFGNSS